MFCCTKRTKVRPAYPKLLLEEINLDNVQLGDLLQFKRYYGLYSHWAVYVGNGDIIHLSRTPSGRTYDAKDILWLGGKIITLQGISIEAKVRKNNIYEILGNSTVMVNNEFDPPREGCIKPFSREEIVNRAYSKLGEHGYNILSRNCEHFATECRYGVALSRQVWDDEVPLISKSAKVVAMPGRKPIPSKSLPKNIMCAKMTS